MLQVSVDLREEVDELHDFLLTLTPDDWKRETGFLEWTPWDVVAHLHYFDLVSMVALDGAEALAPERDRFVAAFGQGRTSKEIARERFGDLAVVELLGKWQTTAHELAGALGGLDAKHRLPWFGPDMGLQMFTHARYMETWAHGQEVYDLVAASRTHSDRIKNIVTIGMKTFGWTFLSGRDPDPERCRHQAGSHRPDRDAVDVDCSVFRGSPR